jgi:hypothetical protein
MTLSGDHRWLSLPSDIIVIIVGLINFHHWSQVIS